jgi:hypothetical protein
MSKICIVCETPFTKRRPNSCQRCYFKNRHQERYVIKEKACANCGIISKIATNKYCLSCRENITKCNENQRIYFGKKFYQDKTGYWICTRKGTPWAHRWVWINHNGEIPKGMHIHHIDEDKSNNDISNLQMLSGSDHILEHWKDEEDRAERRKFLDLIRPLAHEKIRTKEAREKARIKTKESWVKRRLE